MKKIFILLIAILLIGPADALRAQALPDSPSPAPAPDAAWDHLQSLPVGEPIIVSNDNGPAVHCLFARATNTYLDCNPPGNPAGVGYRFDRASVASVNLDLPAQQKTAQLDRPERNYHPAWLASMIAGGIIVGLCATHTTDAGNSAKAGLAGAAIVAAIGAPLAFLPQPFGAGFDYRPRGMAHARLLRTGPRPHPSPRLTGIR